jgi:hydroxyacyl-ACP dehydratase HTD2-like protein with hotdog domain
MGQMRSIHRDKMRFFLYDPLVCGKAYQTTAAIPTHGSFGSVGIKIDHAKIVSICFLEEHQAIRTNAKTTVAERRNRLGIEMKSLISVIDDDEVISGSLVFVKLHDPI